jgi:hypothetical protein
VFFLSCFEWMDARTSPRPLGLERRPFTAPFALLIAALTPAPLGVGIVGSPHRSAAVRAPQEVVPPRALGFEDVIRDRSRIDIVCPSPQGDLSQKLYHTN